MRTKERKVCFDKTVGCFVLFLSLLGEPLLITTSFSFPIWPNMTENFKRILFWLESYWTSNIWKINTKPLRWMIENIDLHCIFLLIRLWRNERAKKDIANISKLFCFNLGHPSLCRFFTDLDFLIIIIWKLIELTFEFSIILRIWTLFTFLSFLLFNPCRKK